MEYSRPEAEARASSTCPTGTSTFRLQHTPRAGARAHHSCIPHSTAVSVTRTRARALCSLGHLRGPWAVHMRHAASPSRHAACTKTTGYGPKSPQARMQPLTLGPEDGETKTMTVARPQHVCVPLSGRRQHRLARSTCAAAPSLRSSPLGADMVGKSRNMSADMLIMPGLLALMPPTICCVRSQSVRNLVTEISGGATPHRCGVAQSSSSELATQAWPSRPHSRLVVPVHVGSRLAHSG